MKCPNCDIAYNRTKWDGCPHCGKDADSSTISIMKTSTILISAGFEKGAGFYRSVDEVPERLRRKLEKSTSGLNAATIVIADGRGRREISRALGNVSRLTGAAGAEFVPFGAPRIAASRGWRSPSAFFFGALLASFAGGVAWLVCVHTW